MLTRHQRQLDQVLTHYYDCTYRMLRDCIIVNHATTLLENALARATSAAAAAAAAVTAGAADK
jgi:hypothetical protein